MPPQAGKEGSSLYWANVIHVKGSLLHYTAQTSMAGIYVKLQSVHATLGAH